MPAREGQRGPPAAALPQWVHLVIEPTFASSDPARDAAMPNAWRMAVTSRPNNVDATMALPSTPATPGG